MEIFKIFLGGSCLLVALLYQQYVKLSKNLPRPDFDLAEYWGKGDKKDYQEDRSIRPFKVSYSSEVRIS